MVIKNIQNMIAECITYAEDISENSSTYPADATL